MVETPFFGQTLKAARICAAAGVGRFAPSGGLPSSAAGWVGVWRVASVTPTTDPAATRAKTATMREIWRRPDKIVHHGSRDAAARYYRLYSHAQLQGTPQEDARRDLRDRRLRRARDQRRRHERRRPPCRRPRAR